MRDILSELKTWISDDEPVALATVVQTWGSAPRRPGARMAITASGKIAGSVSGGCVEAAVIEAGLKALETGRARLLDFHVDDEAAWDVGLACGGAIQVLVKPLNAQAALPVIESLQSSVPFADVMILRGPDSIIGAQAVFSQQEKIAGDMDAHLAQASAALAAEALAARRPGQYELEAGSEILGVFVDVILPPPAVVLVGGAHVAVALASLARTLGYRTVVVDPRRIFGTPERFPRADLLIQAWPDEAFSHFELTPDAAVCMLTHDPKIDDEGLKIALNSPAFYVGAVGSRKTQEARRQRLREAGILEEQLMRLHGPIGLDIGAVSPEEIALSIMAEITAVRNLQGQPEAESISPAGGRPR